MLVSRKLSNEPRKKKMKQPVIEMACDCIAMLPSIFGTITVV